jgi:hypothetical protein
MILIQDILISDDLVDEHFLCDLQACKGACCWEGDFGAPLEEIESEIIQDIYLDVKPFLREKSLEHIENNGFQTWYPEIGVNGTALLNDGACVFLIFDERGIAKCAFERAFEQEQVEFRKPVSCHLYPVRLVHNRDTGFLALNYDKWEICSAACVAGKKIKLPLYQFVKDALVRKFGVEFFKEIDAYAKWQTESRNQ